MRTLVVLALTAVLGTVAACAPRAVPVPVVETPRFPEFLPPAVPPDGVGTRAAQYQDRAWRFLQAGDLTNAAREADAALRIDPMFRPAETTAGYVALARENAEGALAHFDRSLDGQEGDSSALVGRGLALLALAREPEAIAPFEAALVVDPSLTDVRRRVAVLRFRALEQNLADARDAAQAGRLEEANAAYRAALVSSPDSAFLYRELADVERRRSDVAQALEHFRRAVELDPGDAGSLVQIAGLLEARGDLTEALEAYEQALTIDPAPSTEALRDSVRARLDLALLPAEYRAISTAPEVTRGELAALIGVRLWHVLQVLPESVVLTDVRDHWAQEWIVAVSQAGVMEAYPNHTFQPAGIVRRVDLAEAVVRLLPRIAAPADLRAWQTARQSFADLSAGHLAYPAASAAVGSGVMATGGNGAFGPSDPVTGSEAVAAIERLLVMAGPPAVNRGVGWR